MELTELSKFLKEQNESGKGFQIHLNSGNLDKRSQHNTDVEFGDLYFTNCKLLKNTTFLSFRTKFIVSLHTAIRTMFQLLKSTVCMSALLL